MFEAGLDVQGQPKESKPKSKKGLNEARECHTHQRLAKVTNPPETAPKEMQASPFLRTTF